jgi:sRNA-binding protein
MRSAEDALTVLKALYPASIGAGLPLKVGVHFDIAAERGPLTEAETAAALHLFTGTAEYLRACLPAGAQRVALDGTPVGFVEREHKLIAAARLTDLAAEKIAAAIATNPPVRARRK